MALYSTYLKVKKLGHIDFGCGFLLLGYDR